ncbi:nucleotide exchange factor SIL1-like [Diadema antillarum]|uniref:nucleotide exchange factor SIL1-like n=1 Tax=Diadema antillarum TaxID=105358 RepID=UPI003A89D5B8
MTMIATTKVLIVYCLAVMLHISLMCGVISMGAEFKGSSTAITVHESEKEGELIRGDDHQEEDDGVVMVTDEERENFEVFVPTREWQTIQEGQAIPAGLHVRINLATGKKEAKLLDEDEEQATASKEDVNHESEEVQHARKELERRLAKMENDDECEKGECKTDSEELIEEVKKRYRSIEELKKEFADLNLNVETDFEIMTNLITEYKETTSTERRAVILQDLEYYVHQVDNAVDLERLGGWEILMAALNNTSEALQTEAAHVIGSAVQSNPKAQVAAIDHGAMQLLLHLLRTTPSPATQKRALFGLSSLLRFFPYAQKKFLDLGGLNLLSGLVQEDTPGRTPLQIKSVTLLHDLLIEQRNAVSSPEAIDDQSEERKLQYEK